MKQLQGSFWNHRPPSPGSDQKRQPQMLLFGLSAAGSRMLIGQLLLSNLWATGIVVVHPVLEKGNTYYSDDTKCFCCMRLTRLTSVFCLHLFFQNILCTHLLFIWKEKKNQHPILLSILLSVIIKPKQKNVLLCLLPKGSQWNVLHQYF